MSRETHPARAARHRPQCGFSSVGGGGQALTQEDTRRKLELVMEVAREVWE